MALHERQSERHLAWRASAGGGHQGNEDLPVSQIERHIPRYLAHTGTARHGQQRVFRRQSVHSARARHLSRRSARPPERQPTLSFHQQPALFDRVRRRSTWYCPWHDGRVPGPAAGKDPPWRGQTDGGEQRRPVARGAVRGEVAVRALFPSRRGGRGVGNDRGTRRDGPGSAHPPAPRLHLGHSVVTGDRQHAVSRLRLDVGVRGKSVRTPSARHRHGRATGPGAHTALRDGRSGHAWRCRRRIFSSWRR